MLAFIVALVIGIVCVILGISNTKGNISSLHSYHRKRVSEEDRIPFGRMVGLGTIIIGLGVIVFSILYAVTFLVEKDVFATVGTVILIAALVIGTVVSFRAMIKYNKGIF